jgi:hypothetical protein
MEKKLYIPKIKSRGQPAGDPALVADAAKMIVAAETPSFTSTAMPARITARRS